ncbi:MAG TPA: 50S ribosomal protein L7/L12 [Clostridiales bacterium]|nr:50S ribosomal protein L7/L12 [Clostridiales bacterium]
MASEKINVIVEQIKTLTVLEVSELVKELETEFGVSAAAVAVAAGPAAAAPAEEEKTEFDVILTGFGDQKLNVIKMVRSITGLGLGDAKAFVESCPKPVKEGIAKNEAEDIAKQLKEAGATVEIK